MHQTHVLYQIHFSVNFWSIFQSASVCSELCHIINVMTVKHVIVLMELYTIAWRVCNCTGVWGIPPENFHALRSVALHHWNTTKTFGKQSWYVKLQNDRLQEALCFKLHVHLVKKWKFKRKGSGQCLVSGILSVNQKPKINYILQQHVWHHVTRSWWHK